MTHDLCMLCEASGPLEKEHIWPDWYSRFRPGIEFEFAGTIAGHPYKRRPAQKFDLAPKVLCRTCNGVFGSQMEDSLSAVLKPMVDGGRRALSIPLMTQLSAWATLKFMAIDLMASGRTPFFSQKERAYLRRKSRPPVGSALWIGRYVGHNRRTGSFSDQRSALIVETDDSIEHDSWSATYTIGEVVIQLFAIQGHDRLGRIPNLQLVQSRPDWEKAMLQIWTPADSPFNWPPSEALDDLGLDALVARWKQSGRR
jgi:hypothetical protein